MMGTLVGWALGTAVAAGVWWLLEPMGSGPAFVLGLAGGLVGAFLGGFWFDGE